ncbi:MAG: hypothetical protein A3G02_00140 [Candidatus Yanofskybacteria bacterium RIFCSPLOWO2_12_FULL_44_13b]|uniref:valine--tRNA ligase n=2 Tax=Candidatus Yanofskyibacteriota TaxID=1752733 RepID=A0A1F8H0Q6_9BACT|nr:MAG: Valine-tRNA ligase [Candidatus Yanofskybacteria bacterium GW2011_GWB1_45_11]OGN02326.1 MAG: hypothetical protein A2657_00120 [Candidatus Yanofskybacteria bacterium RIFCSPHIGHO2_01_FULL_44_110b]OGN15159.1 MAG: hypothetical protein A3C01_01805 [Candidatus Yanofskybacteria bacterium RIFCSPHIGHO2_02_FULL_44_36b]OGN18436.1 MAG: hypothetical protein A3F50_01395 [Candidatus Yanofskybacteria bacterium RIFCSPHIGHO2_12_FULL_44_29b]OGN26587.1 MAG: hypothetical protein A3B12_01135 [Candidatus Yanof
MAFSIIRSVDLSKTYNPKETEDRIYRLWEESGFFNPDNLENAKAGNFVAAIAPPNITGELHMGHALEHTLQDIIFRMKRMQGYRTLWLPGIDHAGISAQNVVEKQLAKEGVKRQDLGREKFLEKMWAWKEKYGDTILGQFKKLGLSVDWSRTKFTLDPDYQKAVEAAFKHYYEKGWIYKGERVINWCSRCGTSISDLEVNYVPETTTLYYIKYGQFTLATTRPETKLGDTALAVHPDDSRYSKFTDQNLEIQSVDNENENETKLKTIQIKVISDAAVDPKFGTGIIKVTPAHDVTDFEIAQRHDLPSVTIIDRHGRMNANAGKRYEGLKVSEAREKIVKDLEYLGLMEKMEKYEHNIGRCDRCNSVIEPLPSEQWFLKMKDLAALAIRALDDGKIRFHPSRWTGPVRSWLENIRDWNISRQLWWGHKIPIEGEEDVLDTWFSSALWPFAALGWPEKTDDYNSFYPTQYITSARDILYLWIARMVFSGIELTGKMPFKDIVIHPTILTKDGKRMSKSLGTGVNPLDLIDRYGADALRFGLAYQTTGIQDMKFGEETMLMGKKFANKIWNISRYILMKIGDDKVEPKSHGLPIIVKLEDTILKVTNHVESYEFGEAAHVTYDFIWHDLADKYIEETKNLDDAQTKETLMYILVNCLKLLHPFMPFLTEEIYSKIPIEDKKLLLIEPWPVLK